MIIKFNSNVPQGTHHKVGEVYTAFGRPYLVVEFASCGYGFVNLQTNKVESTKYSSLEQMDKENGFDVHVGSVLTLGG